MYDDLLRTPPSDQAAEQSVLGAVLLGHPFDTIHDVLSVEDFYLSRHQRIFAAMQRLYSRNVTIDVLTVCDEVERVGDLETVGGRAGVNELCCDVVQGQWGNSIAHARIVKELSALRALQRIGIQLQLDTDARRPSSEVGREVEGKLFSALWEKQVSSWTPNDAVIIDAVEQIERIQKSPDGNFGTPTGLRDLDRMLHGLQPSDLVIAAGRPGMGKTSLGMSIAVAAGEAGKRVAIASLEMSKRQLGNRLLSLVSGVNLFHITSGRLTANELQRVHHAAAFRLSSLPIQHIDANPMTVEKLRALTRQLKVQDGLDVLIVDYLQLMESSMKRKSGRQEDIAEMSRGLKLLAKELNVCVVALSQLSRKPEDRPDKRPNLADLRESGAIEQDADIVLMLYRDEVYNEESEDRGVAEILIRKHRNGPIGDLRVAYLAECAKFADLA